MAAARGKEEKKKHWDFAPKFRYFAAVGFLATGRFEVGRIAKRCRTLGCGGAFTSTWKGGKIDIYTCEGNIER